MMICKMRLKPFDVLIINRIASFCHSNWSTNDGSDEEKGAPQLTRAII